MRELDFVGQMDLSMRTEPEKWQQGDCVLRHQNGIEIWTGNGFFFLAGYGKYRRTFNLWQKFRMWRAIRRWESKPVLIRPNPVSA